MSLKGRAPSKEDWQNDEQENQNQNSENENISNVSEKENKNFLSILKTILKLLFNGTKINEIQY